MNGGTLFFLALYISSILESLNFLGPAPLKKIKTLNMHPKPLNPEPLNPELQGFSKGASPCRPRTLSSTTSSWAARFRVVYGLGVLKGLPLRDL